MNSMVEVLADYAAKQPEALFTADYVSEYNYADSWKKVQALASVLTNLGLEKGQRIMGECTQDTRYLLLDLAVELMGAIFVPIEHKAGLDRVSAILEESEASLFLCEAEYDVPVRKLSVTELFAMAEDPGEYHTYAFPNADDSAELLYTTGTTGKSKGIEMSHGSNVAIAENIMYGTEMKPGNRELIPLPLSHSHGIRCCYANLLCGGAILVTDGIMKIGIFFELLKKYRATAMDLSPTAVQILMRLSRGKLADYKEQLDYIQIGTAALPEETKEMLLEKLPGVRLYNFYGSTESGRTCVLDFSRTRNRANCIGRPTKNATFIVTDEARHEISSSQENQGLIATAGAMNMKGYWRQPELTAKTMQNGFVYTNDLGYIDEEGFVYVLGRKDDIINYKGIKIAPEEIEEVVRKYKGIVDCACVPKKDEISGQVPKLFISVKNVNKFSRPDFFAFLETQLDRNKLPKEIEVIDEIPRTYNGKLQRAKLMDR